MTQSAQMSKSFRFVDVLAFTMPDGDENAWTANPPGSHPKFTSNKWVYVFQTRTSGVVPTKGQPAKFHGACFVDPAGTVRRVDAKAARVDTDLDCLSGVSATGDVSLPDKLSNLPPLPPSDEQCFYYFWGSPIQLSTSMIALLEGQISRLVPPVDLPDDAQSTGDGLDVVAVVDPVTIALFFCGDYEVAANDALYQTTETADMPESRRAEVRRRSLRQILGSYVKSILEADADNDLKVSDKDAVLANARDYLRSEREALEKLVDVREVAAKRLVRWLESSYWSLVEQAHRDSELELYDQFVVYMALLIDRLLDSSVGKAFFARFEEQFTYLLTEYIRRSSLTPPLKFSTVKKCAGAALSIFTKLIPYMVKADVAAGGKRIVSAVNFLARAELIVEADFGFANIPLRGKNGITFVGADLKGIMANPKVDLPEFETWMKPGGRTTVDVLGNFIEVVNLVSGLRAFSDSLKGRSKERFLAGIKAAANVAGAAKTLSKWFWKGKWFTARASMFGGAVDILLGINDGIDAYNESDWGRAMGDLFVIVAGGASAFGAACEIWGGAAWGSRAGLIGFLAGLVAVAGALIINYFSDTDLETFVKHSAFGRVPLGDLKPKWSLTNVSTWTDDADGIARQLNALDRLCSRFEFAATGPTSIKFVFNNLPSGSRLCLRVRGDFAPPEIQVLPEFVIDALTGAIERQSNGETVKLKATPAVADGGGRLIMSVAFALDAPPPPNQSSSPPQVQLVEIDASLDLYGTGESVLPEHPLHGRTFMVPAIFPDVFSSVA